MSRMGKRAKLCGFLASHLTAEKIHPHAKTQLLQYGTVLLFVIAAAACGKFFPDAGTLVGITISPNNQTIQPSQTQQFTATGSFGNGSSKDISSSVTWTSSATNIATISSTGLATAGTTLGSATITAKSGNESASTTLTVSNQTSGGLTISCTGCISQSTGAFTALLSSGTVTFTATNTSGQSVTPTWSSSSTTVATVGSSTGVATLITAGQTTVTAQASGASGSVTLTVQ